MPQIPFVANQSAWYGDLRIARNGTLTFVPINIWDSISLNTVNVGFSANSTNSDASWTISMGLYSLNGNTLSLANSVSRQLTRTNGSVTRGYISLTDISATQNITPGTWWIGLLVSTGNNSNFSFAGVLSANPQNNFPGSFVGGGMTVSTNAPPTSYATSDLNILGVDAFFQPIIIISA